MRKHFLISIAATCIVGCNSGVSGKNTDSKDNSYTAINPYPYPPTLDYPQLPDGFESGTPSFAGNNLQIAYGYNSNPAAQDLVAFITIVADSGRASICSATPVAGDGNGGTWLVGAAHCFLGNKNDPDIVTTDDLVTPHRVAVFKGISKFNNWILKTSPVTVFVRKDYCQGATFDTLGLCPNFSPTEGASGGQGNDISLIHISVPFNSDEVYPRIAPAIDYPAPYTMAPVLSLGYGNNNVNNDNGILFYVTNYFYDKSDDVGYHYHYNSYFNPDPGNLGYSALVCGGDSGGGDLFWNGINWLLLSEHTYGPGDACGQFYPTLPNGATNVSAYYDWLMNIINSGANGAVSYCETESANCVTNG